MSGDINNLVPILASVAEGVVETRKSLAPYTSYRIGGDTAVWAAPETEEGIRQVIQAVHAAAAPLFVLGRGSNLLVSERGWPGVTLYIGENFSGWKFTGQNAETRAGTLLWDLVRTTVALGLGGMELLAGIPGGIGGALRMNAGAFGREVEATVGEVSGYLRDGSRFQARRNALTFGYRRAPDLDPVVITTARFEFQPEPPEILTARMNEILSLRAQRQPLECPSCGSVFKRPPGYYAGALIEAAGLKGERIGGAQVSGKHAGFILNTRHATANDVYRLIRRIEGRVAERFGVKLEREVQLVGEFEEC